MLPLILEIKPRKGLNDLVFGTSTEHAEKCFGKPEETEKLDDTGDSCSLVWHFWEKGFSLFFDVTHGNKFSCVEIDDTETLLWGEKIFRMDEPQLKAFLTLKGFKDIDMEDHAWGERRVSFDDALMDFYFEHGQMTSINYGITFEEEQVLILPN
jgi:hypothetical protein